MVRGASLAATVPPSTAGLPSNRPPRPHCCTTEYRALHSLWATAASCSRPTRTGYAAPRLDSGGTDGSAGGWRGMPHRAMHRRLGSARLGSHCATLHCTADGLGAAPPHLRRDLRRDWAVAYIRADGSCCAALHCTALHRVENLEKIFVTQTSEVTRLTACFYIARACTHVRTHSHAHAQVMGLLGTGEKNRAKGVTNMNVQVWFRYRMRS